MSQLKRYSENKSKTGYKIVSGLFVLAAISLMFLFGGKTVQAAQKGWKVVNGAGYYYDNNGSLHKGWLTLNGKQYYFDTKTGKQFLGWQKNSQGEIIRFFYKSAGARGYMATGFVKDSAGNIRYFNSKNGVMSKGWKENNGRYRYFKPSNGILLVGIKKVDGKIYYFQDSKTVGAAGYRYQGGWITLNNSRYYFNKKTGKAAVGWCTISGERHYFGTDGKVYTGMRRIGDEFYFFRGKSGVLYQEGFYQNGSITYYFDPEDGHRVSGWVSADGKKYYFDSNGQAVKNTTLSINGITYTFDEDGVADMSETGYAFAVKSASNGKYVTVRDEKNAKIYYMAKEFATHPGIADGTKSDRDILAAIVDAEAGGGTLEDLEAVAMCVLNCTIDKTKEFPSELRYVVYQVLLVNNTVCGLQYSPVQDGSLLRRLNGNFTDKAAAYKAADKAMEIFNAYVTKGTPRYIKGFDRKDFNFMFFMNESSFWSMNLNFSKVDYFIAKNGHVFFVDWV